MTTLTNQVIAKAEGNIVRYNDRLIEAMENKASESIINTYHEMIQEEREHIARLRKISTTA